MPGNIAPELVAEAVVGLPDRNLGRHPEGASQSGAAVLRQLGSSDCDARSEELTSELQSLMRISYAVFCLQKNKTATPQLLPQSSNPHHATHLQHDSHKPR